MVRQAGHLYHYTGEEGTLEEGAGEEEAVLLLLVGTGEVVAELGSQLLVVGEEVEGQQNRDEVEKKGVKVVVGSLGIQILQVGVGVGRLSLEVEAEGQVVEQSQVWDPVESPKEELVVDGLG